MEVREKLKQGLFYLDGGCGTLLQENGLQPGELPETWSILHPDILVAIHTAYFRAGANIASTCTFGANALKFDGSNGRYSVQEIVTAAVNNAKEAIRQTDDLGTDRYVALDIGPTGKLLKPLGDLAFEDAVSLFAEVIRCGVACGVDCILIETMNDAYETKAAVLAAKENCDLPILVSNVYDAGGKLMTGADPAAMVALLEGLHVDAIGMNCSLGPAQMKEIVPVLTQYASVPVLVAPNAGLPRTENGNTVYDVHADEFAEIMQEIVQMGARVLGGCCGTTPEFIEKLVAATKDLTPAPLTKKHRTLVSSYTHAVELGTTPILIGERINPTGKKRFKEALRSHSIDYILNEGVQQEEKGVQILDVNVGLPEIDEVAMLSEVVFELQSILDLPLQIDTTDLEAMERALRLYNGKPMINSVNGKEESLSTVLPLAAKYGGVVVALTLDESGIPETAEARCKIAARIYERAEEYGIQKKDIIIDPLAMAISSDDRMGKVTLEAISGIKRMGGLATLGVSNVSFGLPNRDFVTSTFFALALQCGLDAAIMNPHSLDMMKVYHSFLALNGFDSNCQNYIAFAADLIPQGATVTAQKKSDTTASDPTESALKSAIIKGLKEQAAVRTTELLETCDPLTVINAHIVPALDDVGRGFEQKTLYLPQLLMSAEAAASAFEVVKQSLTASGVQKAGEKIVIATVRGDIHDIGKNIVRVLLENYGYTVLDLGKDVPPETILETAIQEQVRMVGLSALMTTTVPAMEETIALLHANLPDCKIVVGGAVLTQEYADMIGADFYAKDAMETVRFAERLFSV
ncbi:MAG: homocysteine S-methyltransferase family protein [Oscillospiraceae bacterium]|jgi:5-methyltetrahydrofolate--homocysteine methyltransferase